MNIKKFHFNNKSLKNNNCLFNSQINQKNQRKNTRYQVTNLYQISIPNHTLNFRQNIFLPSEQSTLLTSEDYQCKNIKAVEQLKRRNNCHCLCHQIEESIKLNNNNVHIINCHSPDIHCHTHCFNHMNGRSYHRPKHYSVENSKNESYKKPKNFELIYNYEKLKKQYNIISPGYSFNKNQRRNIYNNTAANNKENFCSRNINKLNNNYKHSSRSCDDILTNSKYGQDYLLRKTREILGFPYFALGSLTNKNSSYHYKSNSVKYRNNNTIESNSTSWKNNKDKMKKALNENNKEEEIPNYAKFTFKEKTDKKDNTNNRYNQIINIQSIDDTNNINNNNEKQNNEDLIKNPINTEIVSSNKEDNNIKKSNSIEDNNETKTAPQKNDDVNNKINNDDIIQDTSKKNDNNNINLEEDNNNNISFGGDLNKDNSISKYNKTYSNQINKNLEDKNNKSIKKNNNTKDNDNIDINKDIKDILKERNLFLKIKKKKKGKTENNLNKNKINKNNDIDPNEKLIKDIVNIKKGPEKNNNNKKKNAKYLNFKNNSIDDIIEKILQKNHGKKAETKFNRNKNDKNNKAPNNTKIEYSNNINDKKEKIFGISENINAKDKYFKDLNKRKQSNIKNNKNNDSTKLNKTELIKNNKKEIPIKNTKDLRQILNQNKKDKDKKPKNLNLSQNLLNNQIKDIPKNQNDKNNMPINKENTKCTKKNDKEKKDKINKRSLSTNNIGKKEIFGKKNNNKISINNNKKNNDKNNPYLDIFHLNKINKLIHDSRYKNSILYNKIIQPYNNTKTLLNNNISYKHPKILNPEENTNIEDNLNTNDDKNIIESKKKIFNLSEQDKNKRLKSSKSCILDNRYKMGNIQNLSRNQSANFGNCFACYFKCSVSLSGYSPMNFSPFDGRKREDNLGLPSEILYNIAVNNN